MRGISAAFYTYGMVAILSAIVVVSYSIGFQQGKQKTMGQQVVIDYINIPKEFVVTASQITTPPPALTKQGTFFG